MQLVTEMNMIYNNIRTIEKQRERDGENGIRYM